jgi:hypothetical protein
VVDNCAAGGWHLENDGIEVEGLCEKGENADETGEDLSSGVSLDDSGVTGKAVGGSACEDKGEGEECDDGVSAIGTSGGERAIGCKAGSGNVSVTSVDRIGVGVLGGVGAEGGALATASWMCVHGVGRVSESECDQDSVSAKFDSASCFGIAGSISGFSSRASAKGSAWDV